MAQLPSKFLTAEGTWQFASQLPYASVQASAYATRDSRLPSIHISQAKVQSVSAATSRQDSIISYHSTGDDHATDTSVMQDTGGPVTSHSRSGAGMPETDALPPCRSQIIVYNYFDKLLCFKDGEVSPELINLSAGSGPTPISHDFHRVSHQSSWPQVGIYYGARTLLGVG